MTHLKHLPQPTSRSMPRSNIASILRTAFFLSLFVFVALISFMPLVAVHAADSNPGGTPGDGNPGGTPGDYNPGTTLENPLGNTSSLSDLLTAILKFVTTEIGPVVVTLMLVYCGFLFVVAQGNEEKIRDARSALIWTVIGALVLLGAAVIQGVITSTVNTL